MEVIKIIAKYTGKSVWTMICYAGFWWWLIESDVIYELDKAGLGENAANILGIIVVALISYVAVNKIVENFSSCVWDLKFEQIAKSEKNNAAE